jgi:hypothetical protein
MSKKYLVQYVTSTEDERGNANRLKKRLGRTVDGSALS